MITETKKKLKQRKTHNAVCIHEISPKSCQMSMEGWSWEKVLRLEKNNDGMMMTLVRWDDRGEEMNQE